MTKSPRYPAIKALVMLVGVVVGASASLTLATTANALQDSSETTRAEVETGEVPQYYQSRFNGLTSEVWRYGQPFNRNDLTPIANNNPNPEPQPERDRPERLTLNADKTKLYVTLAGTEAEPGHEIAVVDVRERRVIKRIQVGSRPYVPVLHPGGRFIVVINELSNYATIIDTQTDEAVGEIELDYYCQGLVFSRDGKRAWVANRYLDQVLVLDIDATEDKFSANVHVVGGYDEETFFGQPTLTDRMRDELVARGISGEDMERAEEHGTGGINGILRARCSTCHNQAVGGFVSGPDPVLNLLSAAENSVGGQPYRSPLLRAVLPMTMGGFGDQKRTHEFHFGDVLFEQGEPELDRIVDWIRAAVNGPGISVGNPMAHPKDLVLSTDGRHLFVGNTGTMDVAIIDTTTNQQVGAIFVGNVVSHLQVIPDVGGHDQLAIFTMGAGFGAPKERDPYGAETWDRDNPAAQFTILRDQQTTDPYPIEQQHVMGPYDAIDGTWNFKMRDIQNDLVGIDLARLTIPGYTENMELDYQIIARTYESTPGWVRYTSDTVEATTGDMKGDVPPELQRVPGSFFEWSAIDGDRLFTTMAGSFEVVEWLVTPGAEAFRRYEPLRVYKTGLRPVGIAVTADHLFVANQLSETVSVIDRASGESEEIIVGNRSRPPLDTDAEKGEAIVHTTVFSSDNDTSCLHCHYRDTGDGRGWGAAESIGQDKAGNFTHGGTLGIPAMRNTYAIQPYYFEGTHRLSEGQGADINEPASSVDFSRPIWAGDFTGFNSPVAEQDRRLRHEEFKERVSVHKLGSKGYDLDERRNEFMRQQSMRYFGAAYDLKDMYRFVGAWLGSNNHLLPTPYDRENPSVRRGEQLFNDPTVMCAVCHTQPEFTNKGFALTQNDTRSLPQLTTQTRRGGSYTLASVRAVESANNEVDLDMDPQDRGRVEPVEGGFTTMQLRGIFDRPPVFLHHARARSLREVIATPRHSSLRRFRLPVLMGLEEVRVDRWEVGFNEMTARNPDGTLKHRDQVLDTHGGTTHLGARQLDDIVNFMLSIN